MANNGISDYMTSSNRVYSKYTNKYYDTEDYGDSADKNYIDFDGYLQLLVAQMSNQDFNDPMSDSEMLQQMAQYSMLEGIKNMTQQTNISYASSLVGKVVTVSENGMYLTGRIDSVTIYNGEPWIIINGNAFKSSKVCDIVDDGAYAELYEYLGKTVEATANGETIKGKVQNILFIGGEGYVAVGGNIYSVRDVKVVEDDGDVEGAEGSEGVEGEGGTEGAEGTEGGDKVEGGDNTENDPTLAGDGNGTGDGDSETGEVLSNQMYRLPNTVSAKAQSLADILIKEIDRVNAAAGAKEDDDDKDEQYFNSYITQSAMVKVPEYSAGLIADSDIMTLTTDNYKASNDNGQEQFVVSNNNSYTRLDNGNVVAANNTINSTSKASTESAGNTSTRVDTSADNYNTYLKAYSARRGTVKGVTSEKGVSTSDCVPHRISVEAYPEEAALADALGTRMYDIRFIHNTAITSRIKTGEVIGHTSGGKAITEIGYSGVGQLGEVVTFADGTQRVEIMLKDGRSCWLHTSGNLTLDEICSSTAAPGSLTGKLTPEESAIRHYSRPIGDVSESVKRSMERYVIANSSK